MANTKSAIKTIRRITRQTKVNKNRKARFKNALKKMNSIIDKKNKKDALTFLPKLNSELMKLKVDGQLLEIKFDHQLKNCSDAHKTLVSMLKCIPKG